MSTKLIINGGKALSGEIQTNSAKNSAVAILCATTMIKGKTTLTHVPIIEEVKRIIEILTSIGLKITWTGEHELEIENNQDIQIENINVESFCKTRSALLLMGALSSIIPKFSLPKSGGCKLGVRTVNPFTIALEHLGIKVTETETEYIIEKKADQDSDFTMYEASDTATENTIMAAILKKGTTKIHFAASNYMVQDLCYFLQTAGAKIEGIGTPQLTITGIEGLQEVKDYPIMPDPIESMAFISIAITTGSKLTIKDCPIDFLKLELEKLRIMGQEFTTLNEHKSANGKFNLVDIEIIPSKLKALSDKIHPQPYPGLNIDNLPLFVPILTQTEGTTLVHDWVYENRAIYYTELNKLGSHVTLQDPHRVTITGPSDLTPAEIICPPALRPSINLLICMLKAPGKSILRNPYSIDRGYEDITNRLKKIGADIERIEE